MRCLLVSSKADILVNGSPSGYVRYRRGLRQGDPLSPLLFVQVTDVLGTMFSHALHSGVLIGVPLGSHGMSGLQTNFSKTCLFSSRSDSLPNHAEALTLNCAVDCLPVTYLGIPISRRRPRKQDWDILIAKVRDRLSSWKARQLSAGGRLILLNSVLSAIPMYWMSIYLSVSKLGRQGG
ncbi:uncharacterized protein LOC120282975 [Dioscorea cayenensis subsp. rotundata]|uniref:Uncharacterized protein LOC120282975 n=1 Tax=Dioscorea cayennensis subsp. rotundata TaxID=55577 RepID=A0AB40D037_DIOCR|nr:uncharacterized protein LOC120282975 [Dioscorea cayenensis subsp. rotundata]